jgi:hypothetical protein
MNIPHKYFVVADIEVGDEYVGSFMKSRHFSIKGAFRSLGKKRQRNYASRNLTITHSIMGHHLWNERMSCVNPNFYCAGCDKQGPCADQPRTRN